jgi:hypothetical protein
MAHRKKKSGAGKAAAGARTIRASVSLRAELYCALEALAKQKRVSTAWVLRDAAEKYMVEQLSLHSPVRLVERR